MAQEKDPTYDANYFFRDYVTEDIVSYCIGEVYMYHFKETLIGVRSVRTKVGKFVDIATVNKQDTNYAPTIAQLNEEHVKEAVDEIDKGAEKTDYIPLKELPGIAAEMLINELSQLLDRKLLGEA